MKKVILGAMMFLAGAISGAILLAAPVGMQWTHNNEFASAWWLLSQYGLVPVLFLFAAIALAGLVLAILGVAEKQ